VTRPRQPAPPPLEGNDQLIAAVISVGWVIALIVLLVLRNDLPSGSRWWVWTCVAGLAVGIFGLPGPSWRGAAGWCQPSGSKTVSAIEMPGASTRS
jgi:Protein of unknown function (DUF2530)